MANITYTYAIENISEADRCMEIVYSSDGHQTLRIGARLPFDDETLSDIVEMYNPVAQWLYDAKTVVVPTTELTGSKTIEEDAVAPALPDYVIARLNAYGYIEEQIEYITENGLEAWQAHVAQIKADNPKT